MVFIYIVLTLGCLIALSSALADYSECRIFRAAAKNCAGKDGLADMALEFDKDAEEGKKKAMQGLGWALGFMVLFILAGVVRSCL